VKISNVESIKVPILFFKKPLSWLLKKRNNFMPEKPEVMPCMIKKTACPSIM